MHPEFRTKDISSDYRGDKTLKMGRCEVSQQGQGGSRGRSGAQALLPSLSLLLGAIQEGWRERETFQGGREALTKNSLFNPNFTEQLTSKKWSFKLEETELP